MALFPSFEEFRAIRESGANAVVYTRMAADLDTPVSLMIKLARAGDFSFALESVTGGETRGRYSVIGLKPDLIWKCQGQRASVNRSARFDPEAFEEVGASPLDSLRELLDESRMELPDGLPAISCGLYGYLGYDMIRLAERLPDANPDVIGLPDAIMLRPSVIAVLDSVKGEVTILSPAWASKGLSARAAYSQSAERVMDAVRDMERPIPETSRSLRDGQGSKEAVSNFTPEEYARAVNKAKSYIRAGDIFQVVPSQRWTMEFSQSPLSLYRALRRTNPSPYMFYFNFQEFQIVGASPEILVQVSGGKVTIRPIAGTRPRGANPEEDKRLERELLSDPKELAEHLMLLDLGRNDVGRVSEIGSVRPTETFIIERYSHVMHIVSNVEGRLSKSHDALSALLAGLPAGTVSGAPKIRAMEIIDELEPEKRGVYGGGVGYFASNGDMDICIALRTAVVKDRKLYIQAGGGVVHDSDPQAEFEETVNKSKALMQAAREAGRFEGGGNSG